MTHTAYWQIAHWVLCLSWFRMPTCAGQLPNSELPFKLCANLRVAVEVLFSMELIPCTVRNLSVVKFRHTSRTSLAVISWSRCQHIEAEGSDGTFLHILLTLLFMFSMPTVVAYVQASLQPIITQVLSRRISLNHCHNLLSLMSVLFCAGSCSCSHCLHGNRTLLWKTVVLT